MKRVALIGESWKVDLLGFDAKVEARPQPTDTIQVCPPRFYPPIRRGIDAELMMAGLVKLHSPTPFDLHLRQLIRLARIGMGPGGIKFRIQTEDGDILGCHFFGYDVDHPFCRKMLDPGFDDTCYAKRQGIAKALFTIRADSFVRGP